MSDGFVANALCPVLALIVASVSYQNRYPGWELSVVFAGISIGLALAGSAADNERRRR